MVFRGNSFWLSIQHVSSLLPSVYANRDPTSVTPFPLPTPPPARPKKEIVRSPEQPTRGPNSSPDPRKWRLGSPRETFGEHASLARCLRCSDVAPATELKKRSLMGMGPSAPWIVALGRRRHETRRGSTGPGADEGKERKGKAAGPHHTRKCGRCGT